MPRNIYSLEFKMSTIEQYYKRDCLSRDFAKRHGISYITLTNWNKNIENMQELLKNLNQIH